MRNRKIYCLLGVLILATHLQSSARAEEFLSRISCTSESAPRSFRALDTYSPVQAVMNGASVELYNGNGHFSPGNMHDLGPGTINRAGEVIRITSRHSGFILTLLMPRGDFPNEVRGRLWIAGTGTVDSSYQCAIEYIRYEPTPYPPCTPGENTNCNLPPACEQTGDCPD